MMRFHLSLYVLLFTLYVLISPASAQVRFTDVTDAARLSGFVASWATWGDYDNDGDVDVVLISDSGRRLYRNEGNGRFLDVTQNVGITDIFLTTGAVIFVDFDNDGNLDLFIGGGNTPGSGDVLYHNRRDGTFLDVSQEAGMVSKARVYYGAISFDYDNDGLLDIYVANWGRGAPFPNFLYRNEGNSRFKEIATQIGLDKPEFSFGIALGDYDNDGDLDIFIANPGPSGSEQGTNVLYRNEGGSAFINVAQQAGVERRSNDNNAFFWDYDNDGDLDLFVQDSHLAGAADAFNALYRNNGNGSFTDVTQQAGLALIDQVSWGAYYEDYDNDGWLDLCVTYDNLPTLLYLNNRDGTFKEMSKAAGIVGTSTGAVNFVDYDNDGDLDIYIGSIRFEGSPARGDRTFLYRNNGTENRWLKLKLIGRKSNRDAIGARIKLKSGNLSVLREIAGSSGRGTHQHRLPLHFGLGKNSKADIIEIRWPSGIIQTYTNIPADQQLTISEIEGVIDIYGVFPSLGDPKGGMNVQIRGEPFIPGSKVFFGVVEAINVKVESPLLITAVTPPGTTGLVDMEVVRPDGKRGILKNGFQYTNLKVTKIIPESGPITGGITVEIEGFGFQQGVETQIGGKSLVDVFVTPVLIRGKLPPGTPGVLDVSVTNPNGERDILRNAFTYILPPTIEKISPIFVPGIVFGIEITIKGSGFIRIPTVRIGDVTALQVGFISSNELRISTSRLRDVGPQDVVVINPDGQRVVLPGGVIALAPIEIKSVEPNSGGLAGGTKITIVGEPNVEFSGRNYPSRFVDGAKVFIGNVEAEDVAVQSDHVITAITPPNTPGPKDVDVINVDDQSDRLSNGFIYNPLPQITKIIPNNGPLSGGTKIRIQGSKFLPGAEVLIGDIDLASFSAASSIQVESDSLITAIMPQVTGEPGPKDVMVINPDGQQMVLEDGFTYNPFPTIRDISPNYGPSSGGTKVIIRGTGFLQGARVIIGKRFATTEFKDDETIEAVTPANPKGRLDVKVRNPDTQEAIIPRAFISVGELAYNYPNPFKASQGTTFRYVPGPNEIVESIVVRIFNLAGVPIGVVGAEGSNEVRWQDSKVNVGLYVYLMEVRVGGKVKPFKRMLEVYK